MTPTNESGTNPEEDTYSQQGVQQGVQEETQEETQVEVEAQAQGEEAVEAQEDPPEEEAVSTTDPETDLQKPPPLYNCHKQVRAFKIREIEEGLGIGGGKLIPFGGVNPIQVSANYMERHQPQIRGYYVVYEDGYESYSPEGPFEAGYSLAY